MKQVIQNFRTRKLYVEDVPMPKVRPGGVLVANVFSLISAGTERSSVELAQKSLLGKVRSRPADVKKVLKLARKQGYLSAYKTAMSRLETPTPLGYSSAGIVIEVGKEVKNFKAGDRVACAGGGYASHAEVIFVPENLCALVPKDVPLEWASFTTLGAIAMQGVRQADVKVGETVCVIGLGLLGQLTAQILKSSGCRVIGIDLEKDKVHLAKRIGAERALLRTQNVHAAVRKMTDGYGVDAVIITAATASNDPFILAPETCRDRAKVVLVGVAKLDFLREPYYKKELSLRLARSYGPGRYDPIYEDAGFDYPIGYVRWTEKRNMEAVLQLMSAKKMDMDLLISHKFKIQDATKAYNIVLGKTKEKPLGILFEYDTAKQHETKILVSDTPVRRRSNTQINVGFIGVGNFARSFLLPNIKGKNVYLVGVADMQGTAAKTVAQKYGYKYCTSDYRELLSDETINTIFIATRHNLHAQLITESLKAGKHVFCEKPLCLDKKEINQIIKIRNTQYALRPTLLLIGFNRRFAPLAIEAKEFLGDKTGPYMINYRINAGMLPADHWLLDGKQGGGRVIGEVCHFIDFARHFIDAPLLSVSAECLSGGQYIGKDNIAATLKYEDGSIATITYFAVGDPDFSKERVEIFGDQKVVVIDDFRKAVFSNEGKQSSTKIALDKGYKNEINAFFDSIKNGTPSPILFNHIVETTLATFAINDSISAGKPVVIPRIKG
jgi:predicted dehydrogenase/threonine dehydrogenase-like Zn-dependent dehydrogenase